MPGLAPLWPAVVAGVLSGLLGALGFAAAHALLIVPIWGSLGSGLVFGALAGGAAGWALGTLYPEYLFGSPLRAGRVGAGFGGLLWLLVAPVTAADALLRATGLASRLELLAVGVALVLAIGAGAAFGWRRSRSLRGMLAGATATLALTIAMAGPVPVGNSPRALGIFLAVLPVAILAGALLALLARSLSRHAPNP